MVSLVPSFALNIAGINAQIPPHTAAPIIIRRSMTGCGRFGLRLRATQLAPSAPMVIWPSAPMFQNFILNATMMPIEVMIRGTALTMVCFTRSPVPTEPMMISLKISNGFSPKIRRMIPAKTIESTIASKVIRISFFRDRLSRLVILMKSIIRPPPVLSFLS